MGSFYGIFLERSYSEISIVKFLFLKCKFIQIYHQKVLRSYIFWNFQVTLRIQCPVSVLNNELSNFVLNSSTSKRFKVETIFRLTH